MNRRLRAGSLVVLIAASGVRAADESKIDRLLQKYGFQVAASASPDADFDMKMFQIAHYSTLMWHWKSNLRRQGPPPGIP